MNGSAEFFSRFSNSRGRWPRVMMGCDDSHDTVFCFDAATGQPHWQRDFPQDDNPLWTMASPANSSLLRC
jgi:outer membrane protein assembly factor BamB